MTTQPTPEELITVLQAEVARLQELQENESLKLKNVEYYAASVNAWFNTSLEFDKSMFALSGGGIGLLVSLMSSVNTVALFLIFLAAILCFIVCIGLLLTVFQKNKDYVMRLAQDAHADVSLLQFLDKAAAIIFGIGALLTVTIGIAIVMQKLKIS